MSTIRVNVPHLARDLERAGERIDRISREQALDGVRAILEELKRIDRMALDAMCIRAGMLEITLCYELGFSGRLESIDFKALRDQIGAAHEQIQSAHYAALFPDLWAQHLAKRAHAAG